MTFGSAPLDRPLSPTDLERRLGRALDLAARAVEAFADSGFVDPAAAYNSFGPEKVAAETVMLLHAAAHVRDRPEIGHRFDALADLVAPHARSPRMLVEMAVHPSRAYKLVVPHVLLTRLGHADAAFDEYARTRCETASVLATDVPTSAHIERAWIQSLWDGAPLTATDRISDTFVARPFDILDASRDEAYGLTHLLFYLTNFGHRPPAELPRPLGIVLGEIEALLLRFLDAEDYDLSGELLMAWPMLDVPWSPTAAFAFRVLTQVEDEVGLLPCGNVDLDRLNTLDGTERTRYALATAYHTAYVMGFLCAGALLPGRLPPGRIDEGATDGATAAFETFEPFAEDDQGHWQLVWAACTPRERAALTPALCSLAVLQKLRRFEYEPLSGLLLAAHAEGLGSLPVVAAAAEQLMAVAQAAAISAGR